MIQMSRTGSCFSLSASGAPARLALLVSLLAACGPAGARAQELILPPQPAPPPMRYVPDAARSQLDAAQSPKDRVRVALDLLEQSLARAEQYTFAQRYDPAAVELGVYAGIIDDTLAHLSTVGRSREGKVDGKTRDLYKRIEMALNRHTARIEAMRRQTPALYAGNVRAAFQHARDRRSEALESFFVGTVVRVPEEEQRKPEEPDPSRQPAPAESSPKKPAERPPSTPR
jgi:hypothetical protein